MGEYLKTSHKAQNLARIRDNQRRSRARRKEYLQELEARLRSCDHAGIEASVEIQSAARKVLDENKKLRSLLIEHGVSDADIVAALGGPTDKLYEQVSSTPTLSNVLERRIASNMVSSTPLPQQPRGASVPHSSSVPSLGTHASQPAALSSCESSSTTSIETSISTSPASYHTPLHTAPMTPQAPGVKADYDYSYDPLWPYSQAYTYSSDLVSCYGATTCVNAAKIIRTMRSDTGLMYHTDQINQPCYENNYMHNPITTTYPQQYSRI